MSRRISWNICRGMATSAIRTQDRFDSIEFSLRIGCLGTSNNQLAVELAQLLFIDQPPPSSVNDLVLCLEVDYRPLGRRSLLAQFT